MKNLGIILFTILLISACSKESDNLDIDQVEDCHAVLGWEKINRFVECDPIEDLIDARLSLVGNWALTGFDCGRCDPSKIDTPSIHIVLFENGTGDFIFRGAENQDIEFSWSLEKTSTKLPFIITDPSLSYIESSTVCSDFFGFSKSALDGPTFVYSKCD